MKIYIPYYDRIWKVQEVDTESKRYKIFPRSTGFSQHIEYCGLMFNAENCFITLTDAWKWINKEYVPKENKVVVK